MLKHHLLTGFEQGPQSIKSYPVKGKWGYTVGWTNINETPPKEEKDTEAEIVASL